MVERYLNLFALAFLGVALSLFVMVLPGQPISCLMGVPVKIPFTSDADLLPDTPPVLRVVISRNQAILVGNRAVPLREVRAVLAELPDRPIHLSADRKVPFALVQDVLRAARDAGHTDVSLVTFDGRVINAYELGATYF